MRTRRKIRTSTSTRMRMRMSDVSALLGLLAATFLITAVAGESEKCQDTAWEKVRGMRPEYAKSSQILYTGVDSQGLVAICFEKCSSMNCSAFIVDLERSGCFDVETDGSDFIPEPNVTFYHKICLKVPESCKKTRYWQVERNLGSVMLDSMASVLPETVTRSKCYETCINRAPKCKAAQFRTSQDLAISDTSGTCTLLSIERGTKPQAFRASLYRDEYLENQCHNISKTDFCSYAEYHNMSLPYSDLKISGLDAKQCERRCEESNDGFLCRAYGVEYSNSNPSTCFLHSEDTIGAGASLLVTSKNNFYKEREPCIDMSVRCTNTSLTIELRTSEPFVGRIYASGFSETCGTQGHGDNITKLMLPLPNTTDVGQAVMPCGLAPAYSIDQNNQTRAVIWSTVIVQFNPIIQRLGDQAVKVGCSLDDGSVPAPQNVTVHSGFTFIDSNAGLPPIVSTVMNTSSEVPVVTMKILDETSNRADVTHIGQKLILKIQMSPTNGPFDISAGHLVASTSSGDSSLLLLDEVGCPVTQVFPALTKDPSDNRSLIAEFSAFKFPSSQHVRFNVIVKFCLETCDLPKCSENSVAYGRRRRSIDDLQGIKGNVTELYKYPANSTKDELPLQASIIVQDTRSNNQDIFSNPLTVKEHTYHFDDQFCMNVNLALFLLILLLIIQIGLIGSCVLAVRTYRRMAIRAEEDRADILARHLYGIHGGNFEISRRVRWADNSSPVG